MKRLLVHGFKFDWAKNLANAKNLAEIVELQRTCWRKQFGLLIEQAEDVRALSVNAATDVAEPIKQHATQQAEQVRALSEKMTADAAGGGKAAGDVL